MECWVWNVEEVEMKSQIGFYPDKNRADGGSALQPLECHLNFLLTHMVAPEFLQKLFQMKNSATQDKK